MAIVADIRPVRFSLFARIAAFRAELAERARKNRAYRTTYNELSAMSGRELADIGLSRSMIHQISVEASSRA